MVDVANDLRERGRIVVSEGELVGQKGYGTYLSRVKSPLAEPR